MENKSLHFIALKMYNSHRTNKSYQFEKLVIDTLDSEKSVFDVHIYISLGKWKQTWVSRRTFTYSSIPELRGHEKCTQEELMGLFVSFMEREMEETERRRETERQREMEETERQREMEETERQREIEPVITSSERIGSL